MYSHSFKNVSQPKAYITVHNFDIIYLCEIYIDSDDDSLESSGYNLKRPDHTSYNKRKSVCL